MKALLGKQSEGGLLDLPAVLLGTLFSKSGHKWGKNERSFPKRTSVFLADMKDKCQEGILQQMPSPEGCAGYSRIPAELSFKELGLDYGGFAKTAVP